MSVQGMLIDVTRLAGRRLQGRIPTGVDRVSLAYVNHYGRRARALIRYGGRNLVLSAVDSQQIFDQLDEPAADFPSRLRLCVTRAWWRVPRAWPGWVLFNTGHSGIEASAYARRLARLGALPLFLLHDLIPISHPEYCREGESQRHVRRLEVMLRLSGGLIANSQATLDMMRDYADQVVLEMPPSVAAHLAPPELRVPFSRPIDTPYFVMLGTLEPRKNHWMILQIWRRLAERLGHLTPRLVLIGQRGWECENVIDLLERCPQLRGCVIEQSHCSDAELATWLAHAQALLFPSFAEGYGLPLVEALAMGTPVIASNLPVFEEIAQGIPEYVDPLDGLGWQTWIEAYMAPDSQHRAAQLERMQCWVKPTWGAHFAKVDAFLETL